MRVRGTAIVALFTACALVASVMAGSRKVLVLPLDGNAPAAQRGKLNASVAKMAKASISGDVTTGDATFNETASAVGCNPESPACADTVMTTLSVDELVYGSAATADGSTTIILMRATKGQTPKSQISVISETDSGEQAEGGLAPLFGDKAITPIDGSGSGSDVGIGSGSQAERPRPARNFFDTRERKLGVAFAAAGGIALIIGFSLWSSKDGLQDSIDSHDTETLADLRALEALEDRASSKALWGNIMVIAGLGLGGTGAYFLYKDHQNRKEAAVTTVTPVPVEEGTGLKLLVGGRW